MKTTLATPHWPYGIVIEQSANGILLRPVRKARQGWSKAFKSAKETGEFAQVRSVSNEFDVREWEW